MITKVEPRSHTAAVWVAGVLALTVAGCDPHRIEESTTEELQLETGVRTVVEIRVDDGSVRVTGGTPGVVEVVFTKRARAAHSAGAHALLESVRTGSTRDGHVIRVSARSLGAGDWKLGGHVWTDVAVRVPRDSVELDIRTGDGGIVIDDVSGSISAESGDGRIRMTDVTGEVRLRTKDGSIRGDGVVGDFDVLSEDGRVRLDGSFEGLRAVTGDGSIRVVCREGTTVSTDWSVRTSDGSIELSFPESVNAELEATSADGRIANDLTRFEGLERENRVKGKVGSGGGLVLIATMDGRIVLKES